MIVFDIMNNENILAALPHCVHLDDAADYTRSGCPACPFSRECSGMGLAWMDNGLVRILSDLPPSDQRDHFIRVLSSCANCEAEECGPGCPYYAEFGEDNIAAFYRRIHAFLNASGVCVQ